MVENSSQRPEIPYVHSGIFLTTLNTACRRSKKSVNKNILSIAKVVNFEATAKFWGMEDWRKRCKERTHWTRSNAFPVDVDAVAQYSFSVDFCALSSSCCCIIVASSPSLIIICSVASRLCTPSSASCCSSKASWASLGELIYHLFRTDSLRPVFDRHFRKLVLLVLKLCSMDCVVISGRSKPFIDRWLYMGVFAVWGDIRLCHWPRRWVDGAQCKCKCWFVFYTLLWTCRVTDYCQISSVGNRLPHRW